MESREQGDAMTEGQMQRHFNGEMVVFSINVAGITGHQVQKSEGEREKGRKNP